MPTVDQMLAALGRGPTAPVAQPRTNPLLGQYGGRLPQPDARFTDTVYTDDDPYLRAQLKMGDRGGMVNGAGAFLGAGYNPFGFEHGPSAGELIFNKDRPEHDLNALFDTAEALGMDTSGYTRDYNPGRYQFVNNPQLQAKLDPKSREGVRDAYTLYEDLNNYTKDYYAIDHMTSNGKGMERTLYLHRDGKYIPVSMPQRRSARMDNGFIGRDAIAGLSLVLPAFGGWAGLLGNGAAGTLTAGGGLGLTGSLPSTLVNVGMSSLASGGLNPTALLGAGISQIAGLGGNAVFSPMQSFNSLINSLGMGRTLGRGASAARLLGRLIGPSS